MSGTIKTTEKNYTWAILKREGKRWNLVRDVIYTKRGDARQTVNGLNAPYKAKRQLHRYKVAKMVIASQKG